MNSCLFNFWIRSIGTKVSDYTFILEDMDRARSMKVFTTEEVLKLYLKTII